MRLSCGSQMSSSVLFFWNKTIKVLTETMQPERPPPVRCRGSGVKTDTVYKMND